MTISYQTPVPISLSSQNGSLVLSRKNPQNFYSFRLLFFNSTVNVTVKYYDINGKLVNTVTYTTPESISVKNGDYSLITWNDANNYQVQGWYQEIIPSSQEDIAKLTTEFDLNAVPIGQVNINNPLDTNGNVKVNSNVLPGEIDFIFTSSATANTITQLNADTTVRDEITILASTGNSATINIGNSTIPTFPLVAGASVTIRHTSLSKLYASSSGASQTLYVICGGT